MKFLYSMLSILLCLGLIGCATSSQFTRIGGTKNADLHGIKIYKGQLSEGYSYQSIGMVSAKSQHFFALIRLDNALEDLTLQAKNMGANAIINWKINPKFGWTTEMEGEAVIKS